MKTFRTLLSLCSVLLLSLISCKNATPGPGQAGDGDASAAEELFNGTDLDGWYTYQTIPQPESEVPGLSRNPDGQYLEPIGLNRDPLEVFSVVEEEGSPAIRISGEVFAILVTEKEFENYHLSLEFKWGEEKFAPRKDQKRDSGILYHSIGKEGAWGGVWMKSLECQVQEGDCGDYISVDSVWADVRAVQEGEGFYRFDPAAGVMEFSPCDPTAIIQASRKSPTESGTPWKSTRWAAKRSTWSTGR
ncbi:MAG: DUF1080 domain-containing protein [Bacteroidales bacterium]